MAFFYEEIFAVKSLSPPVPRTNVDVGYSRSWKQRCMKQLRGFQDVRHVRQRVHCGNYSICIPLYGRLIKVNKTCPLSSAAEAVPSEVKQRRGHVS
jgi:hypothetical protein